VDPDPENIWIRIRNTDFRSLKPWFWKRNQENPDTGFYLESVVDVSVVEEPDKKQKFYAGDTFLEKIVKELYVEFSPVGEQELQHHNAKVEKFAEYKSAEVDVVPEKEKCLLISDIHVYCSKKFLHM
jgi:hypothetical protein